MTHSPKPFISKEITNTYIFAEIDVFIITSSDDNLNFITCTNIESLYNLILLILALEIL